MRLAQTSGLSKLVSHWPEGAGRAVWDGLVLDRTPGCRELRTERASKQPVWKEGGQKEREREKKKTPKVSEVEEERERRSERCSLGLNSAATKVPSTEKKEV